MKKIILLMLLMLMLTGCGSQQLIQEKDTEIENLRDQLNALNIEKNDLSDEVTDLELIKVKYENVLVEAEIKEETISKLEEIIEGKDQIIDGLKELNGQGVTMGGKAVIVEGEKFLSHYDFVNAMLLEEKKAIFSDTQMPTFEEIKALYERAVEIEMIYGIGSVSYGNDSVLIDEKTYYLVTDNRFRTLDQLKRFMSKAYDEKLVDEFLAYDYLIEHDGELYTSGGEAGTLIDQEIMLVTLNSYNIVDKAFTYNIFIKGYSDSESFEGYGKSVITIVKKGDDWLIEDKNIEF